MGGENDLLRSDQKSYIFNLVDRLIDKNETEISGQGGRDLALVKQWVSSSSMTSK